MGTNLNLTVENIPKELRLIIELVRTESVETVWANQPHLLQDINWELFIKQLMHHRIYPIGYKKLKDSSSTYIPTRVVERLAFDYKRNTMYMLHLSGEMERLNRVFFNKNIRSIYLKGPVLAHELYGDVSLRTSSDLDILVPINDLKQIEETLVSEGYEKDDYIESVLNDWKWRHHHVTFFHPQKRVKVEVHWRLNPGPGKEPSFEDLWMRKQQSKLFQTPVYLLGKEDMFFFLTTHGARHGWSRLRWLVDINKLMEESLDWNEVSRLMKAYHTKPVGLQSLILVSEILGVDIPVEFSFLKFHTPSWRIAQGAIFYLENMVNLHTHPLPDYVAEYHKRHLFSLLSFNQKLLFLLSVLHPYHEDVETLRLPKSLHILYFPLRPVLWIMRKKKSSLLQRGRAL